jgi:peptidylprolyl isomerase
MMTQAKEGDTVKVHYTGKLEDGTIFSSSADSEPLEFTIGLGQIIPGFEKAVIGMNPGETKTVSVPAEEAFGPHLDELVIVVQKYLLPPDLNPQIGDHLQIRQPDGQIMAVTVIDSSELTVTLDANHPLAGKDLTFDIQLLEFV